MTRQSIGPRGQPKLLQWSGEMKQHFDTRYLILGSCAAILLAACFGAVRPAGPVEDDVAEGGHGGDGGANDCSAGGCGEDSHCGDGEVTGSEACDDGVNDGSLGGCNPDCTLASYCGDIVECDSPMRHFRITGGQFVHANGGDPWPVVAGGCMSWQLHDVQATGSAPGARYEVRAFAVEVVEPSVATHMLTVVPNGQPSPVFSTGDPSFEPDSGLVNVYADGFMDTIISDISIDGQPVDQQNTIGGPAFEGAWTGMFPEVDTFSVSVMANLMPLGFFTEVTLTGTVMSCSE